MKSRLPVISVLVASVLLLGCRQLPAAISSKVAPAPVKTPDNAIRENALNLLCDLLGDEKNLSKLLIIKKATPDLKQLVKAISQTAATELKTLDTWRGTNRQPAKALLGLPPGETATRDAISKTKQHELLHGSGSELEFQLLLTQVEALNYGKHLALVISQNEPDVLHAQKASAMSQELNQLREQALALLRSASRNRS
jgi:hypothetical protein